MQRNSQSDFTVSNVAPFQMIVMYVMYAHANAHVIVDLSSLHCNTGRKTGGDVFSLVCTCG